MKLYVYIVGCMLLGVATSCNKTDFLNAKPDQSLTLPVSLNDYQAILDNENVLNGQAGGPVPSLGEIGADNYYLLLNDYNNSISPLNQRCYTWAQKIYAGEQILDWNIPYRCVYYCNTVLDGLQHLTIRDYEQPQYNNILGSALFFRAHCFYQLAQVFAPYYKQGTTKQDLGIPLRQHADIGETMERASLTDTYNTIINDLLKAVTLLPSTPLNGFQTRPSKAAAYGLLARIYQTIQVYDKALLYADSSLKIQSILMDFNDPTWVNLGGTFSFKKYNPEVIFHTTLMSSAVIGNIPARPGIGKVDSVLFQSYNANDLRKTAYFKNLGGFTFTGTYDASAALWGGLSTDEMYLIRAECYARSSNMVAAMADLNSLLIKRWKTGTFIAYTATSAQDALAQVLTERRKELCFRGLRWTDLRRLNDEGAAITLQRNVNGTGYTLPPNDNRYTYPIPDPVIGYNPNMPNNPR